MTFSTMGKEVLSDGAHFADAMSPEDAERIADALNATSEDASEPDALFLENKFWRAPEQVCERVPADDFNGPEVPFPFWNAGKFQTEESEVMREPAPYSYWDQLEATAANLANSRPKHFTRFAASIALVGIAALLARGYARG